MEAERLARPKTCQSQRERHKDRGGERGRRVNRPQKQHKVTDGDHLELNKHCYGNEIHPREPPSAIPDLWPSVIP